MPLPQPSDLDPIASRTLEPVHFSQISKYLHAVADGSEHPKGGRLRRGVGSVRRGRGFREACALAEAGRKEKAGVGVDY